MKTLKWSLFATLIVSSSLCYSFSITDGRVQRVDGFLSGILQDQGTPEETVIKDPKGEFTISLYAQRVVIDIKPYGAVTDFSFTNLSEGIKNAIMAEAKKGRILVEVLNSGDVVNEHLRFFQSYEMSNPSSKFIGNPLKLVTLSSNEQSQLEEIFFDTLPQYKKDLWYANETDLGKAFENYIFMESARSMLRLYIRWNKDIDDSKLVLEAMTMAAEDLAAPGTEAYARTISAFIRPEVGYLIQGVGASYDKSVFETYLFEVADLIRDASLRDMSASDELMKVGELGVKLEKFREFNNSRKVLGK
jgi:hypothetical protein